MSHTCLIRSAYDSASNMVLNYSPKETVKKNSMKL